MKNKLSYLKPLAIFILIGLILLSISRFVLFVIYSERLLQLEDYFQIFVLGFRIDLIVLCYASFLPTLLISLVPDSWSKCLSRFLVIYCSVVLFFILFMEMMTPEFINQFDTRPNKLFLEYLIYPKEIFTMLFKARPLTLLVMVISFALIIWAIRKLAPKLFVVKYSPYLIRLVLFPIIGFFLFWGARGSLTSRRPINASNSIFSTDQLANVLGVNSLYTVLYAAYSIRHETSPSKLYGKMEVDEILERVSKYRQPVSLKPGCDSLVHQPYNLVIFLQESLGAEYVGALGGKDLTPNLDALAKEGLLFTQLYCTGTRSVRGIEAVVSGFLPSPSESVVKLPNSQQNFFTLASLLKDEGYNTSFIYGGLANFDNMASFLSGNGFDNVIDERSFDADKDKTYALKGTWGYSDEDLVVKANEYFKNLGDKPFFSFMFSSSNHEPFEFPDGRIDLYEEPKNSVHNAMKYADFAIGKFFELAKKEAYYKNTIFLIVADHNTRTFGANLVPVDKFHIPALILGPGVEEDSKYEKLCSQIDLAPSIFHYMGIDKPTPMVGRDLIALPDSVEGRAIMQFHDIHAFRVGNKLNILQPQKEALQFELVSDTEMKPIETDKNFAKDALAHVLLADYLYKNRLYILEKKSEEQKD